MDFEERLRQKRRQLIKTIIAEASMVVAVFAIMIVAVMASMGFFVSKDGTIEQSGLLQLHSQPTGASVELDGVALSARTNMSKALTAGEHHIKLSRDGYDTWQKQVQTTPGMLVRLFYPRLFLLNRKSETVMGLGEDLEFYTVSPDRTYILYAAQDSPKWQLINLKNDDATRTELDLAAILPGVEKEIFAGQILELKWSDSDEQMLAKVKSGEETSWLLVNLKDVAKSLNLTKIFGLKFDQVEMIDASASQLFALSAGQLRKINTADQSLSRVLLERVRVFSNHENNLIYAANTEAKEGVAPEIKIGLYRDGEVLLATAPADATVFVAALRYFGEDHIAWTIGQKIWTYRGTLPVANSDGGLADLSVMQAAADGLELPALPDRLRTSPDGDYLYAAKSRKYMMLDLETEKLTEYDVAAEAVWWLDDSMMTGLIDGRLVVWDFDHTNVRTLVAPFAAESAGFAPVVTTLAKTYTLANLPALVSSNNKWLYYTVQTSQGKLLQREKIRD